MSASLEIFFHSVLLSTRSRAGFWRDMTCKSVGADVHVVRAVPFDSAQKGAHHAGAMTVIRAASSPPDLPLVACVLCC